MGSRWTKTFFSCLPRPVPRWLLDSCIWYKAANYSYLSTLSSSLVYPPPPPLPPLPPAAGFGLCVGLFPLSSSCNENPTWSNIRKLLRPFPEMSFDQQNLFIPNGTIESYFSSFSGKVLNYIPLEPKTCSKTWINRVNKLERFTQRSDDSSLLLRFGGCSSWRGWQGGVRGAWKTVKSRFHFQLLRSKAQHTQVTQCIKK